MSGMQLGTPPADRWIQLEATGPLTHIDPLLGCHYPKENWYGKENFLKVAAPK